MDSLLKKPSAWIPIALSLAMMTLLFTLLSMNGVPTPDQNKDEGVGAHLFQIWLVLEVLIVAFFAIRWLPQMPKQTLAILAIQIALVIAGCAPVAYFHL